MHGRLKSFEFVKNAVAKKFFWRTLRGHAAFIPK